MCSSGRVQQHQPLFEMCPLPVITSVQPARVPVEGGTRVIITGTDLGAAFSHVLRVRLH